MSEKNKGGRPPHVPTDKTRKQVEALVGYGIPEIEIGKMIGIHKNTLLKYYREEIDTGTAKANAKVAQSLYKKATGDGANSVTAAIFWLKTRAGWKETVKQEITAEVKVDDGSARDEFISRINGLATRIGTTESDPIIN